MAFAFLNATSVKDSGTASYFVVTIANFPHVWLLFQEQFVQHTPFILVYLHEQTA